MKLMFAILTLCLAACAVSGSENELEARGTGKFALLTNLAILLAVKVGLLKIFLAIVAVIGAVKLVVFMAWALAIFKYVPDPYIYYNTVELKTKNPIYNLYDVTGYNNFNPLDHHYRVNNFEHKYSTDHFDHFDKLVHEKPTGYATLEFFFNHVFKQR